MLTKSELHRARLSAAAYKFQAEQLRKRLDGFSAAARAENSALYAKIDEWRNNANSLEISLNKANKSLVTLVSIVVLLGLSLIAATTIIVIK